MTITAAADGSALGNPGPAGWAWYIDDSNWRSGGWPHGTNNMGELQAVLDLLESTQDLGEPLRVLCDSQYVINSITKWMKGWKKKGWKKSDGKPVLNVELMKALDAAMQGRDVTFEWVKGHAGHELNEAADARANAAAKAFQAGREPEQGPGLALAGAADPQARVALASDEAADAALPDARAEQADEPADQPQVASQSGAARSGMTQPRADRLATAQPRADRLATAQPRADRPGMAQPVAASPDARPVPGAGEDQREDLGDPDPDLLSALDQQSEDLAAGRSLAQEVFGLERSRLTDGLAPGGIHPEAVLIAADGRPAEPESLQQADASADLHLVGLLPLSRNAVQVTVHVVGAAGSAVHTSLWTREDSRNELGEWLLRHLQVTVES